MPSACGDSAHAERRGPCSGYGTSADTGEFAVASIEAWWKTLGRKAYPDAKRLGIVADSGGSNGARNTLWRVGLQKLADTTGLRIDVSHMPPGTSKWKKIEHRMSPRYP